MKMLGKTIARGPGGLNCTCCGTPPGKARKAERRATKRSDRNSWKKDVR